jgi:hypothetical protein
MNLFRKWHFTGKLKTICEKMKGENVLTGSDLLKCKSENAWKLTKKTGHLRTSSNQTCKVLIGCVILQLELNVVN